MRGRKDATAGGVERKGLGLHYKLFGAFGRRKTAIFLRNPRAALANSVENHAQYRKLG
jgi:hypothetical protein